MRESEDFFVWLKAALTGFYYRKWWKTLPQAKARFCLFANIWTENHKGTKDEFFSMYEVCYVCCWFTMAGLVMMNGRSKYSARLRFSLSSLTEKMKTKPRCVFLNE